MTQGPHTEIRIGAPHSPVLSAFMADRSRVAGIMGPLGSGKTFGCIQKLLALASEQLPNAEGVRPTRWAIIRNTYPDLAGTTMKDFLEVFIEGTMGRMVRGGIDPPTFHCHMPMDDGTTIKAEFVFMALDSPKDVRKLRGTQFTGGWCNEFKELPKAVLDMLDGRIGRYPSMIAGGVVCTWKGIFGDTNAPDDDHWYHKLAEEETPKGWGFYRQPGGVVDTGQSDAQGRVVWTLNPHAENVANLPDQGGYYLNQLAGKDDDWIRINLANQYGFFADGDPVHPNYIDSLHCYLEPPPVMDSPIYLGVDFGRTPAAAIIQRDKRTDRKICIDEFTSQDMSAAIFAPELKRYLTREYPGLPVMGMKGWGDPSGDGGGQANEDTPFLVMRAEGFSLYPAQTNAIGARRASLTRPMIENCIDGKPRFMLSPKARMIRKGLRGGFCYRRIQVTGEKFTKEPDKNMYSHPCEGLEYGMMGLGEYHLAISSGASKGQPRRRRKRTNTRMATTS